MVRKVLGVASVLTLIAAFWGCGGFSEEKATQRCDQERTSKSQCVTDKSYDACVSCYQECGEQCHGQATCPETYECQP
jgi:hypothetical protein